MPSRIVQVPGSKDLRLRYPDEHCKTVERDFDLVVCPWAWTRRRSRESMAPVWTSSSTSSASATPTGFTPLSTSRPGVFVGGASQEPKDIPETVTQASAAGFHGHGTARAGAQLAHHQKELSAPSTMSPMKNRASACSSAIAA